MIPIDLIGSVLVRDAKAGDLVRMLNGGRLGMFVTANETLKFMRLFGQSPFRLSELPEVGTNLVQLPKYRFEIDPTSAIKAGNYDECLGALYLLNGNPYIYSLLGDSFSGSLCLASPGNYPSLEQTQEGVAFSKWRIVQDFPNQTVFEIFSSEAVPEN